MVNLVKQLLTSRLYWSIHDLLLKFWWVGAGLLVCFWTSIYLLKSTGPNQKFEKNLFSELEASEEKTEVIDWAQWALEKISFETSIEAEPIQQKEERIIKQKTDIEIALENLNKRYPNRKYCYWKTVTCKITAYTPDARSCGNSADGLTSKMDNAYRFDGVATSPVVIPYRTGVYIPGVGIKEVDDTGGAMRQAAKRGLYHIDVRMKSHEEAEKFGVKWQKVHLFKLEG